MSGPAVSHVQHRGEEEDEEKGVEGAQPTKKPRLTIDRDAKAEPASPTQSTTSSTSPDDLLATPSSTSTSASIASSTATPSSITTPSSSSSTSSAASAASAAPPSASSEVDVGPPRPLSKAELLDLIERGAFWQVPEKLPVYDDPSDVRTKITAFLATKRMTQKALSDLLGVSPATFRRFMTGGATGQRDYGAGMELYPAAYRFFESLRLLERRPKSGRRLGMERAWGAEGHRLWVFTGTWSAPGQASYIDEWDKLRSCDTTQLATETKRVAFALHASLKET